MSKFLDLYKVLGFTDNKVSQSDIKAAYRRLAKESHPDLFPEEEKEQRQEEFRLISEAYEILYDPEKRKLYDETGNKSELNEANKLREKAVQEIINLFMQVFDQIPDARIELVDMKAELLNQIFKNREEREKERRNIERDLNKIERAMKRLRHKGKDDIIRSAFNKRVLRGKDAIKAIGDMLKILDIMKEIADDYSYDKLTEFYTGTNTTNTTMTRIGLPWIR